MRTRLRMIRRVLPGARTAWFAAVAGTTRRGLPVGTPRRRRPGGRNDLGLPRLPRFAGQGGRIKDGAEYRVLGTEYADGCSNS